MTTPLQVRPITDIASVLPDEFLICRDQGHDWRLFRFHRCRGGVTERSFFCPRCKTAKHQELSRSGLVTKTWRDENPRYLIKGHGRQTRGLKAALRTELLARMSDFEIDPEELSA